jgi:hypothetical protein
MERPYQVSNLFLGFVVALCRDLQSDYQAAEGCCWGRYAHLQLGMIDRHSRS